jgi:hypothetical protein
MPDLKQTIPLLVEKLRLMADQGDYGRKPDPQDVRRRAADALLSMLDEMERLREALEPFARACNECTDDSDPDPDFREEFEMEANFAKCFAGPEPVAIKGGDPRILVNGAPIQQDFRIISEGNYRAIMAIIKRSGIRIDEVRTQ